jgi:hypothetical protein
MNRTEAARYRYGQIQIITGLAIGCWKGIYFWYLFAHLGLDASEVAILGCGQFIMQLLLEIPSGTWAEHEDPGNLLSLAYGAFLGFSLLYGVAGLLHVPSMLSIHAVSAVHAVTLVLAVVAECFFGAGTALLSGTLDAWVGEIERSAANKHSDGASADFQQRLLKVKSYKFLSQGAARALVGTATFFAALKLDHVLGAGIAALIPWGLAAVLYVGSLVVVRRFVTVGDGPRASVVTTLRHIHPWGGQGLANLGRYSRRAAAYLRESPETLRIVLVTALPMVAFWSTQAFSVAFLLKALGVSKSDDLGTWAGRIPLFVVIWAGAEFAMAAGATLSGRRSISGGRNPRALGVLLLGFTVALAVQLASVGMARVRALKFFALAYVVSKLLEGWVRKDTDLLLEKSIVSERATHLSIQSFIHAFLGLIFLAGTGYLMSRDPVSGYAFIFVVSAVGTIVLLAFPLTGTPLGTGTDSRTTTGWRPVAALAASGVALTAIFIVLNLDQVVGKPWMLLSGTSDSIAATRVSSQVVIPSGWSVWPGTAGVPSETPHTKSSTWWLGADADDEVTCSVPDVPADDLVGADLNGAEEGSAVLRYRRGSGTMSFRLASRSRLQVSTSSDAAQPFECSAGHDASIRLVPVRVLESLQSGTTPVALWIEVLVGVCIVGALAWLGNSHSLRVLAEAQRLGPVTSALKEGGYDPMKVWHPTLYLRSLRLPEELGRFAQELGVTSLVVGGFRLERRGAIHAWGIAFTFGEGAPQASRIDPRSVDRERMPAWVRGYIEDAMDCQRRGEVPVDDATTRRYQQTTPASIDEWPVPGGSVDGSTGVHRALVDPSPPFVAVACSVAKEGSAALFGFAGAVSSDLAESYVDPVGRSLLRMLAEVGLTQHRAAEFRFQMRGHLYDAADRMTQTRVTVGAVRDEGKREGDVVHVRAAQLDQLVQVSTDNELEMERVLGKVPLPDGTVELKKALEKERGLAGGRPSRYQGRVRIDIDFDDRSNVEVSSRTWAELRRVLFQQLLRGALFHGCSASKPDVRFTIAVLEDVGDIRFMVANDVPSDWQSDGFYRAGSGLATAGSIVQRIGGCWSGVQSDDHQFVVRFSVPSERAGRALVSSGSHVAG